ncbi:CaiB/BaiF CoA transferase family protein [Nocardia fluminea]|uniref:CaiB/BaiF CoA transferase family protein n=1 Tax=Nocardia fluminea TaxID=134984 RepID=UPI00366E88B9
MTDLPLSGIRVLDLATILAAPLTCALLAEFGAEVVKIEHPETGDATRRYPPLVDGESPGWQQLGRRKKSIGIDLHDAEGAHLVKQLARDADIVVTNFRPPTLARFGLDFDDLRAVNDRLVVVHLTAYGRTGPYRDRPGFARVVEAFAGLTHRTGEPGGPPMFSGYAIADGVAGMYGAYAAMLALRQRDASGDAQLVDLALYEPVLRMMEDFIPVYGATGTVATRVGNDNPAICPNGIFPTADSKWVVLPASTNQMWRRLLAVMDRDDLSRFDTMEVRVANRALIDGAVAEFTSQHSLDALLDSLHGAGIAAGPVNTAAELVDDPHICARGSIRRVEDRAGSQALILAPAGRFSGFEFDDGTPAPAIGQDTDDILAELGLTPAQVGALRDRGVVN